MVIHPLCERPGLIPALAQAHIDAFGKLLPDWTVQQATDELRSHDQPGGIPCSWVALQGDDWLGSVSLLQNDHEDIRQYSPWLASLVVQPAARGQGIGRALVQRCVQEAARLQVPRLYLYCTDAVEYYRALGWRVHDQLQLGPLQVTVMVIEPAGSGSAKDKMKS